MAFSWLRRHGGACSSGHEQPPKPVGRGAKRRRSSSPEATGRLAGAVGGELDRLRSDLAEELVVVRLLLKAGHVEAASRLIDEQSARLRHFQDHVEAAIASAVVERTAEEILVEAADARNGAAQAPAGEDSHEAASVEARTAATPRPRLRLLVAAASLVVLVAVLMTGGSLPGLYQLVSERWSGSSDVSRDGDPPAGKDTNATADDGSPTQASEEVPPAAESKLDKPAEAPEILLLLGRLARFAEGTRTAPVAALLDVDRLVRLVTEVAPLLAPLPPDRPQGQVGPAPRQPTQPNAAPQPQPNSAPQPSVATGPQGEPAANQPQPAGPSSPEAPALVTQPAPPTPPTDAPGDAPTPSEEVPRDLAPRN